jgi:hypothetical protein
MSSRFYTIAAILYVLAVFGFACLMQWTDFMQPLRDWANYNDRAMFVCILVMCLPMPILFWLDAKAMQRERNARIYGDRYPRTDRNYN